MEPTLTADLALARRLEHSDASGGASAARTLRMRFPAIGAEAVEFAGGYASFCGPSSPVTRARGVAVGEPITKAEVDRLEAFFFDRGANVALTICPFTDRSLTDELAARGYRLAHWMVALAMPLAGWEPPERPASRVVIERATAEDAVPWATVVERGFGDGAHATAESVMVGTALFWDPTCACYQALLDDELIAGGAVRAKDGLGYLFAMSTLPEARGQGAQSGLLEARIRYTVEQGCDLTWVVTSHDTPSERNAARFGFRPLYSRASMFRAHPDRANP